MSEAICIKLGGYKDRKDGRRYIAHRIEDGEIITTPESMAEQVNRAVTSETGIWDKEAFDKRFTR